MSNINYDKKRHLELLKLKFLKNQSLTKVEQIELNNYQCLLDNTLDWETKEEYLELIEKLIFAKINSFEFYLQFQERNSLNGNVMDCLKANFLVVSPHEKASEFANYIMDLCHSYTEIFESYLSEEEEQLYYLEFRNYVEEIYLKIQKFLNLE